MTPSEFDRVQIRQGWLALAAQVFDLTPGETYCLDLLSRRPGVPATFDALQAYCGRSSQTQTKDGAKKRIERLRAKLADAGCEGVVEIVQHGPSAAAVGYVMAADGLRQVEAVILDAHGVARAA